MSALHVGADNVLDAVSRVYLAAIDEDWLTITCEIK